MFFLQYATYRGFWNEEDHILYLTNDGSQLAQLGRIYMTSHSLMTEHCATSTVTDDIIVALLVSAILLLVLTLLLFLLHLRMSLHRRCPLVLMLTIGTNCIFTALIVRYLRGYEMHACLKKHSQLILPPPPSMPPPDENISAPLECFQETLWSLDTPRTGEGFLYFRISSLILISIANAVLFLSWVFTNANDNDESAF